MSLKILNEGFKENYPGLAQVRRSRGEILFLESIRKKMFSLAESSMSDEDKRDTELLKQIYRKTQQRANAALTPEEKEVLKKYNLERNPDTKNVRLSTRDIPVYKSYIFNKEEDRTRVDPNTGGVYKPSDRINYADRARKSTERGLNSNRFKDDYFTPVPDYESEHEIDDDEYRYGMKYQRAERIADNRELTKNVRKMKDALQSRRYAQTTLDNSRAEQDAKINDLKSQYEKRLAYLKDYYDRTNQYSKRDLNRANDEINTLLKKEKN